MQTRIRSIKPEALLDEDLWDVEQETGFPMFRAFVGLWCCADREGRFEWKPRRLKPLILPHWDGDFSRVLDALATHEFIGRYACGTRELGVIRTFKRHQSINGREAMSILPAPPKDLFNSNTLPTRQARVDHALSTRPPRDTCMHVGNRTEQNRTEQNRTEQSTARAREEDQVWKEPTPDSGGSRLRLAFASRYEVARGCAWSHARYHTDLVNTESWCVGQSKRENREYESVQQQLINNFFTDDWAAKAGYPFAALAKDPGKYYKPPGNDKSEPIILRGPDGKPLPQPDDPQEISFVNLLNGDI